ncbi:MAG: hypothetical protein WAO09_04850 [Candidatus Dormiibacterota bacterium]|jgi:hypothetical protein
MSAPLIPGAVRAARFLLLLESGVWLLLSTVVILSSLLLLSGASGDSVGVITNVEPGMGPVGWIILGVGLVLAVIAGWGIWSWRSMRRLTRGAYISAVLFGAAWICLGLVWVRYATTPIPGMAIITVNAVMLVGLAGPSSSRAAFRG